MTERRRSSKSSCVPPTEPVKSVSPVKTASPSTTKDSIPRVWPGVRSASTRRSPVSTTSPWPSGSAPSISSSGEANTRSAEALLEQLVVGDVVGVGVRRQQVRRLDLEPLDRREQRLDRRPGVDEHGRPAGPVGDEIGVREPRRSMLRSTIMTRVGMTGEPTRR